MEVGAVKQAFNNEVILLKKKLNQAKIQVIHKLTRKAKTFAEKKVPEKIKEKLKRKAESAVNEVLIIKKIKPKDIAKFIVTHKGELKDFLNRPKVDEDKACARLLLHKTMQDKYKFIRGRFANVPIQDLFMSRLERRKMKKEAKEKQMNKKKGKESKVVNSEGDWDVEDVDMGRKGDISDDEDSENYVSGDENDVSGDENYVSGEKNNVLGNEKYESEVEKESDNNVKQSNNAESDSGGSEQGDHQYNNADLENKESSDDEASDDEKIELTPKMKHVVSASNGTLENVVTKEIINDKNKLKENVLTKANKKNPLKKQKDANRNKNFNEKILQRKFRKDSDTPVLENKIVDPFFITSSGENYLSVVEPRQPDEVKDIHKQGNRKLRRAVMFGHVPKIKPRQDYRQDRFNKQNGFENNFKSKFNDNKMEDNNYRKSNFNVNNDRHKEPKEEKLHPSWEAKKKQSGILPFEGKKIVFNDS